MYELTLTYMGYTNYWWRPAELPGKEFAAATHDIRIVLKRLKDKLAGPSGTGDPIVDDNTIAFNGKSPSLCESFFIDRLQPEENDLRNGFCKTRLLPYDLAVKVVLLVLKHHFGEDFEYGSDGRDQREWRRAKRVCREILGYPKPDSNSLRRLVERVCRLGREHVEDQIFANTK